MAAGDPSQPVRFVEVSMSDPPACCNDGGGGGGGGTNDNSGGTNKDTTRAICDLTKWDPTAAECTNFAAKYNCDHTYGQLCPDGKAVSKDAKLSQGCPDACKAKNSNCRQKVANCADISNAECEKKYDEEGSATATTKKQRACVLVDFADGSGEKKCSGDKDGKVKVNACSRRQLASTRRRLNNNCCQCVTQYLQTNLVGCGPWEKIDKASFKSNVCDTSSNCHATVKKAVDGCSEACALPPKRRRFPPNDGQRDVALDHSAVGA